MIFLLIIIVCLLVGLILAWRSTHKYQKMWWDAATSEASWKNTARFWEHNYWILIDFFKKENQEIPKKVGVRDVRGMILQKIDDERRRQLDKWKNDGSHLSDLKHHAILAEEFGEISMDVCKKDVPEAITTDEEQKLNKNLETELIQTAAVCVQWLEKLHKQKFDKL